MFCTESIVCMVSIMSASVFATVYLLTEALTVVYGDFGLTLQQSACIFIALGLGLIFVVPTRLYDQYIAGKRQRNGEVLQPEDKLFGFYIAAPTYAIALWWFAWTIPPKVGCNTWLFLLSRRIDVYVIGFCRPMASFGRTLALDRLRNKRI